MANFFINPFYIKKIYIAVDDSMNGPTRRDDGNEIRRGGSPVGNRGPPSGETRYRPPAFREDRDHRDRDYFRRNDDRNMRDGPPDREENFRPFRDDGGRRDRDIMRGGDDDSRRRDDRPPPPREDRLRDRDEMRRRDDLDSGFRRRGGADDLRRPGGGPPLGRDRDDGLRRRGDDGVDRMARGGDLFRPSMRGEGGPPPRENRDRDNFRPSQSNLGMQRGEDRDEFRYLILYSFRYWMSANGNVKLDNWQDCPQNLIESVILAFKLSRLSICRCRFIKILKCRK